MANATQSKEAINERENDYSSKHYFDLMTKYWRAANYISVGQLYLQDNPLLKRPLTKADLSFTRLVIGAQLLVKTLFTHI